MKSFVIDKRIADGDVECWKVMSRKYGVLHALWFPWNYEISCEYRLGLRWKFQYLLGDEATYGFHSYERLEDAERYCADLNDRLDKGLISDTSAYTGRNGREFVVCRCVISEGSLYYVAKESKESEVEYVSDAIRVVELFSR